MNKIELNRLSQVNNNEQNFLAALNENLKRIQEAINDTLSRTGVKPNQMEEVLDMNGNRICNVGPAVELTDVVTKQDIQNIIDAANEAIARLDGLVEAGKTALMNYAQEYIYPTVTAALDGAQAAQRAAEAARDALVLDPGYQAVVANLTNLLALANDLANVDTLVNNLTNIDTVANNITDVSTVAGVSSAVSTLAAMTSTLTALENDLTNIDTVAGNIADVNTVAGLSSAVAALADISNELTALYNNITAINAVYADLTKIDAVEGKLTEIEAVYDALSDISAVEDALTDLTSIADNLTALLSIVTNMTSLLAVSNDLTNLDAIAADLTNLDAVASNLAAILAAPSYASQAAASASNAQIWAEGTDQQVVPLGGQHSAKVWAQYIEEIIAGTRIYGGTFDPTTATATLTSSAKAKLGITSDTIVLTNDSTAVTGYAANEGIEYYVAVDGTFASLTLHEGDILWSTGNAWKKIDNAATEIPDATESVKGIAALASTAEAEAGANDTKIMTPLKTKQAILELAPAPADASESTKGIVELASEVEATAGSNDTKAMTPETTKKAIAAQTYNSLNASQETTLLSNGTYLGTDIANGTIFLKPDGTLNRFTKTVATKNWITGTAQTRIGRTNLSLFDQVSAQNGNYVVTSLYYGDARRSTDRGATWVSAGSSSYNASGTSCTVYVQKTGKFYCGTSVGLLATDGTASFSRVGSSTSSVTTYATDGNVLCCFGGCYTFDNEGTPTWTAANYSIVAARYDSVSGVFYGQRQSTNGYYESTDGYTWTLIGSPGQYFNWVAKHGSVVVGFRRNGASNTKRYVSTDGGVTWTSEAFADQEWFGGVYQGLFYMGRTGGAADFMISTDGVTWTQMNRPDTASAQALVMVDDKVYMGNYAYYFTTGIDYEYALTPLSYTKSEVDTALADKQDTLTAGTGISISNDTISTDALRNTATGTNSLTIGGTATNATASINIGIGSVATGATTVAIGQNARSTAAQAYEIGTGTNSNHHTLRIGYYINGANVGYTLLDGNTGKVPTDRYIAMVGADGTNAGTIGAVPAPAATDNTKFLRGDGTWAEAGGGGSASYNAATQEITLG